MGHRPGGGRTEDGEGPRPAGPWAGRRAPDVAAQQDLHVAGGLVAEDVQLDPEDEADDGGDGDTLPDAGPDRPAPGGGRDRPPGRHGSGRRHSGRDHLVAALARRGAGRGGTGRRGVERGHRPGQRDHALAGRPLPLGRADRAAEGLRRLEQPATGQAPRVGGRPEPRGQPVLLVRERPVGAPGGLVDLGHEPGRGPDVGPPHVALQPGGEQRVGAPAGQAHGSVEADPHRAAVEPAVALAAGVHGRHGVEHQGRQRRRLGQ